MTKIIHPSFAKGELSPELNGRVDIAAYAVGLKTARNIFVRSSGGARNRPGTQFIGMCKDHSYAPRLIPFQFKTTDQYVIEMGNLYARFIRNGAYVLESAKTITGATQANPVVITATSHGFSNGDDVEIYDVGGMKRLNSRRFRVAGVTTHTFQLTDPVSGANIDGTAFAAYTSGGTAARVYTLSTPYATADLDELKFVQSADVMTLTHRGYAPRQLSRTGHTSWTLTTITFAPTQAAPTSLVITPATPAAATANYAVTAINAENGEESLIVNGAISNSADPPNNTLTWTAASGASKYSVYRLENGLYVWIGDGTSPFVDDNLTPDYNISPPDARNPFNATGDYPAVATYFEQRRVFGGTINKPDTLWFTRTGLHGNLTISQPIADDVAITATLASQKVNEIRGLMPNNVLLAFTSGSEHKIDSGSDAAFSATSFRQKPQSDWGISYLRPLAVGNTTLFVEDSGARVRTLGYSLQLDGYTGANIGLLASHLTESNTIVDWDLAHAPDSIIYMCRDDGELLTLTFNQEQEVTAWTHWDTLGNFERVIVLYSETNGIEDEVYFVVKRKVNGQTVRYVEKLHTRIFEDVRDCFFVDCGLSLDVPVTITDATEANPVVITAVGHGFSNGDEVDIADIEWEPDFDDYDNETQPEQLNNKRFTVRNKTTDTFELEYEGIAVDGSGFNAYVQGGEVRKAVSTVTGLDHLEGLEVIILADGSVVRGKTVASGAISLGFKASRVHVGRKFISDMEPMNVEAPTGTIQGIKKKISYVILRLRNTRGLWVGPTPTQLTELPLRELEDYDSPTDLFTGDKRVDIESDWNTDGRVFLRQRDPLPMEVLAIVPDILVEDA